MKLKQNINNTKIDSKPNNPNNNNIPEPSSRNAKKNIGMKKSVTTYPSKKFNPEEFNKRLESFKEWENKRKDRIKQLEKEQREKEKKLLKNPEINKEANLKFNINPKNYTAVERLYTQDLIKRKEKKIVLTKIYTPTFRPKLYTNKYNIDRTFQQNNNTRTDNKLKINKNIFEENEEDEEEEENNNYYQPKRYKTLKNFDDNNDESENDEDEEEKNYKKIKIKKGRRNLSVKKKKIKISDDEEESEDDVEENDNNNKIQKYKNIDRKEVGNKLRDLLFKNRKPIGRRNNSVGRRKKG